jgi:hypothetical protein
MSIDTDVMYQDIPLLVENNLAFDLKTHDGKDLESWSL